MPFTTLISPKDLHPQIEDPTWVVVDCRFDLHQPDWGEEAYKTEHIPGAVYAHLERDLSALPDGTNGRHPLPTVAELSDTFSRLGISDTSQVVGYDDAGGKFAVRIWWCLRYLGHDAVAILDGGLPAWRAADYPVRSGWEQKAAAVFVARPRPSYLAESAEIHGRLKSFEGRIVDSRSPERYRGEEEPFDPVAGHIPGALNRFWELNLDDEGRFRPVEELRTEFQELLRGNQAQDMIFHCGSGVTGCHNLLAMLHAGLEGARLYAGSWSEWVADPSRPVATGEDPSAQAATED